MVHNRKFHNIRHVAGLAEVEVLDRDGAVVNLREWVVYPGRYD